jgi:hypothetical protein
MVVEFVKAIEDFMEVEVTEINIAERWMQCPLWKLKEKA